VGIGAVNDGDAFISLGTSAQYFISTATYRPYPQAFIHAYCHALPNRWFQMAAMLNGASCLAWAARLLGEPDLDALLARVETEYRGPGNVLFLPYLTGERTPHNDPHARGVFFGMTPDTSAEGLIQAVLEGVALSLGEAQDVLALAGTQVSHVVAIGGGSRSRLWMRILASLLGCPVWLHRESAQGPAFGAARLARLSVSGESAEQVCTVASVIEAVEPDPASLAGYQAMGERFRRLYRVLRSEFHA